MMKKILACVAVCSIMVGMAQGADIRYRQSGDWTETAPLNDQPGWQNVASVPTIDDLGIVNWGGNTLTLTTTESIGELRVGQDEPGNLIVTAGGVLTTDSSGLKNGRLTLGQGNNLLGTGTMTVQAGGVVNVGNILFNGNVTDGTANISGTVNVASHLWTGWGSAATGTYNINSGGLLDVEGMLGLGWQGNGGIGLININDGGTLDLAQLHGGGDSVKGSSLITIADGGTMYKSSNFIGVIDQYILDGKIVGEGGAALSVTYDDGLDRTVVTVIPEPATLGLLGVFGGAMVFIRRRFKK